MERDTHNKVREMLAHTLKVPVSEIEPDASADDLDAWDSLAQVNLIMSLEQIFDVELDIEEFMELTSLRAIVDYLDENHLV